jgi:hypothetical protein
MTARQAVLGFTGLTIAVMTLPMLTACAGGAEFGMDVNIPPERQYALSDVSAEPATLQFPKDKPLNIYEAQRTSTGDAAAESKAAPEGTAFCSATARAGGTASSEFQIGHALDNRTDAPVKALATFNIDFAHQAAAGESTKQITLGAVALKLYIKDSSERILAQLNLLNGQTDTGPKAGSRAEHAEFEIIMQPKTVYHFVVAGKTNVTTAQDTEANARLEIKSLNLQLQTSVTAG